MKLGLVQTEHNAMYDFLNPVFPFTTAECRAMQKQQVEQNLALLAQAAGQQYDLLVTTECINYIRTANHNRAADRALYPRLDDPQFAALGQAAKAANAWLVAGAAYRDEAGTYNAALLFDRTGTLRTIYRKTHLAGDEADVFTPGSELCVQDADFGRFGVCICWDMQFPEVARSLALRGAQLVVCPTWGWEADLYGKARAYENGIFTAAAMVVPGWGDIEVPRTPSSVIAPDGTFAACGPADRAALVSCELDLTQTAAYHAIRLDARRPELYEK